MTKKSVEVNDLIKRTFHKAGDLSGLDNHFDVPTLNCSMIVVHMSNLLRDLSMKTFVGNKVNGKKAVETLANVLDQIYMLCDACNFEIPDDEATVEEYNDLMLEPEQRADAILATVSVIASAIAILEWVSLDNEEPVWTLEEFPPEFTDDILTMICGIRNVGKKLGISYEDIVNNMSA